MVLIITAFGASRLVKRLLRRYSAIKLGKKGEKRVAKILKRAFRKTPHYLFNHILIETDDHITQIDHVVISTKGIFVVETKNLKGWIFGSPQNQTWTQTIYGKKYKHYNPLKQNYKHIRILETALGVSRRKFHSVIVFTKNTKLKTAMPENVMYTNKLRRYIRSFEHTEIGEEDVELVAATLAEAKLENTRRNIRRHKRHVRSIKKRKRRWW